MLIFFYKILPLIKKEFRQIRRDFRTLFLLTFFPSLLLLLFGFAVNFDVKNISIVICDEDKSYDSRNIIESFSNNEYFNLYNVINDRNKIDNLIMTGKVKSAIIIPKYFSKNLKSNNSADISVIIDGSDSNTGGTIINYIMLISQNYTENIIFKFTKRIGKDLYKPIELRTIVWFNPELKTVKFLLPGLIAFILMIVATVSTTLSIVREKERGNMEQLYVSPISAFEIIIGKAIPYLLLGLIASTLVLFFGVIVFDIQIKGSIILLYLIIILFIMGALGMGLLISTISDSSQVAFNISLFASLLPTFILSGFIFPIKNMPIFLQVISYIVPAKYFIVALRAILLKGVGITYFGEEVLFLFIFASIMFGVSTLRFIKGRFK